MAWRTAGRKPRSRGKKALGVLVLAAAAVLVVERASDAGPESSLKTCYEQLAGDGCNDVWHRTQRLLGTHKPDTDDALHTAFVYVCVEKKIEAPRLCDAFRAKATRLKAEDWRYSRSFRDQASAAAPACPAPTAEDEALSQAELDVIDDARARLDKQSRLILDLAYQDDLNDAAIGALLNPAVSAHRVRGMRRDAERELEGFLRRCR
jgi:DNA-directed RNA polymerase specialized sigma24 family protein